VSVGVKKIRRVIWAYVEFSRVENVLAPTGYPVSPRSHKIAPSLESALLMHNAVGNKPMASLNHLESCEEVHTKKEQK
jgi:hypothetical protein